MANYFYIENMGDTAAPIVIADSQHEKNLNPTPNLQYKMSGSDTWLPCEFNVNPQSTVMRIPVGGKMFIKGTNTTLHDYRITTGHDCNVGGDITTLLNPNGNVTSLTAENTFAFRYLFNRFETLKNAQDLILTPTELSEGCYDSMFSGCYSLITFPVFKATTLAKGCYRQMFIGCNTLSTMPELTWTSLPDECYMGMFQGCVNLTRTTELPNPTSVGLKTYENMFNGCNSLNYIKTSATNWDESKSQNWVSGVAPTGTFEKLESNVMAYNANAVPTGWTIHNFNPNPPEFDRIRLVQLLRNQNAEKTIEYFIGDSGLWTNYEFLKQLKDGEQVLGRYKISEGKYATLYGVAHIITNFNTNEVSTNSYIEVFQSQTDALKYGNGIIVEDNVAKARLTNNGGLTFDNGIEGQKGIKFNNGENIKVDGNGVSILKDDESIIQKQGTRKLQIGTVDCGDWTL